MGIAFVDLFELTFFCVDLFCCVYQSHPVGAEMFHINNCWKDVTINIIIIVLILVHLIHGLPSSEYVLAMSLQHA